MKINIFIVMLVLFTSGCTNMYTPRSDKALAHLSENQKVCLELANKNSVWSASGTGLSFLAGGAAAAGASAGWSLVGGAISAAVVSYSNLRDKNYVTTCTSLNE